MKKDNEVRLYLRERKKGCSQEVAAARAGISVRAARKYEKAGQLPSQMEKKERTHRTRKDPFEQDWAWVQAGLKRDPALQAKVLFGLLCQMHPERYQEGQLRTFQRRIETWRALHGPDRDVIFEQVHVPGRMAQSDFTEMKELGITIAGEPFQHLLYHVVLTYSNHEAARICFSESFESLAEGIESGLWQFGGSPEYHRTDNLSAAVRRLDAEGQRDFTERYEGLMRHYGMTPTRNHPGESHQNGDVEKSHDLLKTALDQALRVRGSRDFRSREEYDAFLQELIRQRNLTRSQRFAEDQRALKPLPKKPLDPVKEVPVTVSRFSTIRVLRNVYSVPSRLIGSDLLVKVRSEELHLYRAGTHVLTVPRLRGEGKYRIDYRHVIWSLARKPGAFAAYRYRDEFFPTTTFRRAYDDLAERRPERGDAEYLRILHLAASQSEADVETALDLLLADRVAFDFIVVRDLVNGPKATPGVPQVNPPRLDLSVYDRLLPSRRDHARA